MISMIVPLINRKLNSITTYWR